MTLKRPKLAPGDLFYLALPGNRYVTGRVLFDVEKQYHKLVDLKALMLAGGNNYFGWYKGDQLVEMYAGIYDHAPDGVEAHPQVLVPAAFMVALDSRANTDTGYGILGNRPVDYTRLEFPEVLDNKEMRDEVWLDRGELHLLTRLSIKESKQINISGNRNYPSIIGNACLFFQNRADLITSFVWPDYLRNDLRRHPELRQRVYAEMGLDPEQSYYELARQRGFDLGRFYDPKAYALK
ncbi:MAG: hypothetical protein MUC97_13935 [Bernardetiaceae bacterium]|nr:hypothetical protein [Bernardetiaceae bacterium]